MENIVRTVRDVDPGDRRAFEHIVGHPLCDDQKLVIHLAENGSADSRPAQSLEDWTGVYEGLTEEQIEEVDRIVKTRANLTRKLP